MNLRFYALLIFVTVAGALPACNIPVFRYALERWKSDPYTVIVFRDKAYDQRQQESLKSLKPSGENPANIELVEFDLTALPSDEKYSQLWQQLNQQSNTIALPHVVVRATLPTGKVNAWHGPLDEAAKLGLANSPARDELAKRLLRGDSIVWLLINSSDKSKNDRAKQLLTKTTAGLEKKVKLPEGVGIPGSELFSEVPLLVQYSILEIEAGSAKEKFLTQMFGGIRSRAFAKNEPLIIPVFGRGRALEVIPAVDLNANLIEDLTIFLNGPCSCQVKERNPGFDILMAANWDRELFGEEGQRPPAKPPTKQNAKPDYLKIPLGRKR